MSAFPPVVALAEAGPECGNKAAALGTLLRAGLPVPDGFVVTDPAADPDVIAAHLRRLRPGAYAVRSSGRAEDSAQASFAGQLETVLGARDMAEVVAAIRRCAASANAPRAAAYREHLGVGGETVVPVLVQELVEADRAGVLFTRDPRDGADTVVIDASWGLGESVVAGSVTPDHVTVPRDGAVRVAVGAKQTRLDLGPGGLARTAVPASDQVRACLSVGEIAQLAALGRRCAEIFGPPQDVEWAAADGLLWLLQSRPVTGLPPADSNGSAGLPGAGSVLAGGVPGSPGRAVGVARLVGSVDDFGRVRPGDVLVCRTTDPAWTPLFRIAAAVVTETGGPLSHAAIVAREYRIPAVVGAGGALSRLVDGAPIAVDGTGGTIVAAAPQERNS